MKRVGAAIAAAAAVVFAASCSTGEAQNTPAPYKLGMFQDNGRTFAGMVVDDALVVDLSRANVNAPATLHELIARWDQPTAERLGRLAGDARRQAPSFSFQLSQVRTLVPIPDPDAILILEVFPKPSRKTPQSVIDTCKLRLKAYDQAVRRAQAARKRGGQ